MIVKKIYLEFDYFLKKNYDQLNSYNAKNCHKCELFLKNWKVSKTLHKPLISIF